MTFPNRVRRRLRLLVFLTLGLLAGPMLAAAPDYKDLLADLRKALVAPANPAVAEAAAQILVNGRLYEPARSPDPTPAGNVRPGPVSTPVYVPASNARDSARAAAARYVDALETQLAQDRLADAQQLLNQLRQTLAPDNPAAAAALGRLVDLVQARITAQAAEQDAAYEALATDFTALYDRRAPAAAYDDLFKRLASRMQAVARNYAVQQKLENFRNLAARWQDYLLLTEQGQPEAAGRTLDQFIQEQTRLALLPRSQLIALQESVKQLPKPPSETDAIIADLRSRLAAIIASATKAEDFDDFMVELGRSTRVGWSNTDFRTIQTCASIWQDFFAARASGNLSDAASLLRYFEPGRDYDVIYPYEKMKVKLFGSANPEAARAERLIPPDELTFANLMVLDWQIRYRRDHALPLPFPPETLLAEFQEMRVAHFVLVEGSAPLTLEISVHWDQPPDPARLGGYGAALARVKNEMLHRAVRIYLDLPEAPAPESNDSFNSYVQRLLGRYAQQQNWPMVYRLLSAKKKLKVMSAADEADYLGFGYLMYGLQLERAGLGQAALNTYNKAFESRAPHLPPGVIAARQDQMQARLRQPSPTKPATSP